MSARSSAARLEDRAARVLAELGASGRCLMPVPDLSRYELRADGGQAPRIVAEAGLVEAMFARDWLVRAQGGFAAGEAGLAWLRRRLAGEEAWRGQHLATQKSDVEAPDGARATVAVVANESPLAWLRSRRGADGRALVSDVQYAAGERLRADFERGRLGPRVTADWTRPSHDRKRQGGTRGAADLADATLAARQRVGRAVAALGPDLGSLLVDVCCFLTGLEDAERRRHWPRRSAKVVLAIALDRLAAHYGLSAQARGPSRSRGIRHWGEEDYRPRLDTGPVS